jgi:hypothetical protein
MTAEEIVRALAAREAPRATYSDLQCGLCDGYFNAHAADCPWRLALEWVAEHPRIRRDGEG